MNRPATYYSNIVNLKTTPAELVFEFGAVFPEKPPMGAPVEFEPDVRVVLSVQALQILSQALQNAIQQVAELQKQNVPPQSEPLKKTSV